MTQITFTSIESIEEPLRHNHHPKGKRTSKSRVRYWLKSLPKKMTVGCQQQLNKMKKSGSTSSNSDSGGDSGDGGGSDSSSSDNNATTSAQTSGSNRNNRQGSRRRLSASQQDLMRFVPEYLKPFMHPYHGEYCYTPIFQSRFIAQLMAEGFLPVATSGMLLPKLHVERSVIPLPGELHISKSARKKSKRFRLTINQEFDEVIKGCHEQHGSHCWLYPPLVQAFREMQAAPDGVMMAAPMDPTTGRPLPNRSWKVRLYTIEVWNEATGALAGGELGYTVGSIYTSLTGFTKEDSAGSVQLAALGRLLSEKGFHMWDLGMDMEYKQDIGSQAMPREAFVRDVHRVRETHGRLVLPAGEPAQNCKDIIDRNAPQPIVSKQQPQKKQAKKKQSPKGNNTASIKLNGTAVAESAPNRAPTPAHSPPPPPLGSEAPTKKKVRKSD